MIMVKKTIKKELLLEIRTNYEEGISPKICGAERDSIYILGEIINRTGKTQIIE